MNKENLLLLADHLEKNVSQEQFDMSHYRNEGFKSVHDCGTVGCAVGHAPFVKGLEPIVSDFVLGTLSFCNYEERVFQMCTLSREYDWCFSGYWTAIDNTSKGAALRIRELVNNGLPKNSEEQEGGIEPYMFQEYLDNKENE